tara:strand:+ start:847 stop:1029 length:183 start_codon:yes stop_codon:yes gene_type:complete
MTKTVSFDGETISINAGWLGEQIAEGEIDAKQLWNLMRHELLHLTEQRARENLRLFLQGV